MSDDHKANGGAGNPAIDPTEPRPIWSDDGDAPFDMGDDPEALDSDKPIYATPRPKKAKRVKKEKSASNETVEIIKTGGVCELRHDGNSEGGKGRGHHAAASRRIEIAAPRAFGFGRAMAM